MGNWRQVLSWQLVPELTMLEKRYVLNTGRMPQQKLDKLGLDLSNWGKITLPVHGVCYIAADVFRYIIQRQAGEDVEGYSVNYEDLVENNIPLFDFIKVINYAIDQGPDVSDEGDIEELLADEDANIIKLN